MGDFPALRDYSRSRAVLVGTWDYTFLDTVKAASYSLRRMQSLLTGPLCGWPADRLLVVRNRSTPGDLPDRLMTAFNEIPDVALFYFVGHGQISPDDELCLGLRKSRSEPHRRASTSLKFSDVRQALKDGGAATRIVILDCCFAGLATRAMLSGEDKVLDLTAGAGAYTMAATGAYTTAWYENDPDLAQPQTYFTKYLGDLIAQGIPGLPSQLQIDPLFKQLRHKLSADHRPVPLCRTVDGAREFAFAHNAAPPETHRDPEEEVARLTQQLAVSQAELDDLRAHLAHAATPQERQELQSALDTAERQLEDTITGPGKEDSVQSAIDEATRQLDATQASRTAATAVPLSTPEEDSQGILPSALQQSGQIPGSSHKARSGSSRDAPAGGLRRRLAFRLPWPASGRIKASKIAAGPDPAGDPEAEPASPNSFNGSPDGSRKEADVVRGQDPLPAAATAADPRQVTPGAVAVAGPAVRTDGVTDQDTIDANAEENYIPGDPVPVAKAAPTGFSSLTISPAPAIESGTDTDTDARTSPVAAAVTAQAPADPGTAVMEPIVPAAVDPGLRRTPPPHLGKARSGRLSGLRRRTVLGPSAAVLVAGSSLSTALLISSPSHHRDVRIPDPSPTSSARHPSSSMPTSSSATTGSTSPPTHGPTPGPHPTISVIVLSSPATEATSGNPPSSSSPTRSSTPAPSHSSPTRSSSPTSPSSPASTSSPQQVAIPDVIGLTSEQATEELARAGFLVALIRSGRPDRIYMYSPTGEAAPGATITIWC